VRPRGRSTRSVTGSVAVREGGGGALWSLLTPIVSDRYASSRLRARSPRHLSDLGDWTTDPAEIARCVAVACAALGAAAWAEGQAWSLEQACDLVLRADPDAAEDAA
jgi:hypothetical protein